MKSETKEGHPAEPWLQATVPVFLVGDVASTMQWYSAVLGFEAHAIPASAPHAFCILNRNDVQIFLQQLDGYEKPKVYDQRDGGVWSVYIRTQGVVDLFRALSEREDVEVLEPLCRQPYDQTEFVIRDPNGYTLVFAEGGELESGRKGDS